MARLFHAERRHLARRRLPSVEDQRAPCRQGARKVRQHIGCGAAAQAAAAADALLHAKRQRPAAAGRAERELLGEADDVLMQLAGRLCRSEAASAAVGRLGRIDR
jgi:hypothetical protein